MGGLASYISTWGFQALLRIRAPFSRVANPWLWQGWGLLHPRVQDRPVWSLCLQAGQPGSPGRARLLGPPHARPAVAYQPASVAPVNDPPPKQSRLLIPGPSVGPPPLVLFDLGNFGTQQAPSWPVPASPRLPVYRLSSQPVQPVQVPGCTLFVLLVDDGVSVKFLSRVQPPCSSPESNRPNNLLLGRITTPRQHLFVSSSSPALLTNGLCPTLSPKVDQLPCGSPSTFPTIHRVLDDTRSAAPRSSTRTDHRNSSERRQP